MSIILFDLWYSLKSVFIKDELLSSTVNHTVLYYVIAGHYFGYKFLFSSSRAYKKSKGHRVFINLRNGCGKVLVRWSANFFFCLIMKDRLSARNILKRKSMQLNLIIVSFVYQGRRKLYNTFPGLPICYKEMWAKIF